MWRCPCRDDTGAALVEYVLLVALLSVTCLVSLSFLGVSARDTFESVRTGIGSLAGGGDVNGNNGNHGTGNNGGGNNTGVGNNGGGNNTGGPGPGNGGSGNPGPGNGGPGNGAN